MNIKFITIFIIFVLYGIRNWIIYLYILFWKIFGISLLLIKYIVFNDPIAYDKNIFLTTKSKEYYYSNFWFDIFKNQAS